MAEPMTVHVEVWPVAADEIGIWLVSGEDAWRPSLPVPADSEPHAEVDLLLAQHQADTDAVMKHSTSWRADVPGVILTYIVILQAPGLVRDRWPDAQPVGLRLAEAVGKPPVHAPVEPPAPRYIDVLLHALRHLRFLLDTDASNRAAMNDSWRRHLSELEPAFATMYEGDRSTA
jgi:hypothetical protein